MRIVLSAVVAAGLLALGACGSSDPGDTANAADEANIATDDLTPTDNLGAAETLGDQANALEVDADNFANAVDANVADPGNAAGGTTNNAAGNAQ